MTKRTKSNGRKCGAKPEGGGDSPREEVPDPVERRVRQCPVEGGRDYDTRRDGGSGESLSAGFSDLRMATTPRGRPRTRRKRGRTSVTGTDGEGRICGGDGSAGNGHETANPAGAGEGGGAESAGAGTEEDFSRAVVDEHTDDSSPAMATVETAGSRVRSRKRPRTADAAVNRGEGDVAVSAASSPGNHPSSERRRRRRGDPGSAEGFHSGGTIELKGGETRTDGGGNDAADGGAAEAAEAGEGRRSSSKRRRRRSDDDDDGEHEPRGRHRRHHHPYSSVNGGMSHDQGQGQGPPHRHTSGHLTDRSRRLVVEDGEERYPAVVSVVRHRRHRRGRTSVATEGGRATGEETTKTRVADKEEKRRIVEATVCNKSAGRGPSLRCSPVALGLEAQESGADGRRNDADAKKLDATAVAAASIAKDSSSVDSADYDDRKPAALPSPPPNAAGGSSWWEESVPPPRRDSSASHNEEREEDDDDNKAVVIERSAPAAVELSPVADARRSLSDGAAAARRERPLPFPRPGVGVHPHRMGHRDRHLSAPARVESGSNDDEEENEGTREHSSSGNPSSSPSALGMASATTNPQSSSAETSAAAGVRDDAENAADAAKAADAAADAVEVGVEKEGADGSNRESAGWSSTATVDGRSNKGGGGSNGGKKGKAGRSPLSRQLDTNQLLLIAIKDGNVDRALKLISRRAGNANTGSSSSSFAAGRRGGETHSRGDRSAETQRSNRQQVPSTENRGITPLMLAAQKGSACIVRALLEAGSADVLAASSTGTTALIQASHFGHLDVVKLLLGHGGGDASDGQSNSDSDSSGGGGGPNGTAALQVEQANYKSTTALMRAAQEGHDPVVRLLLRHGADPNRVNIQRMTALMLASQRGHAPVVRTLLRSGADADRTSSQDSTALMLACKRDHVEVARRLVAAGCELAMRDGRGRTAADTARRRGWSEASVRAVLSPEGQVRLMRAERGAVRNFEMVRLWTLLQKERAKVETDRGRYTIHNVASFGTGGTHPALRHLRGSRLALIRTMALPAPLVEMISAYLPLPDLWEDRVAALVNRCHVDPDSTVSCTLDIMDEVLVAGGFAEAFYTAGVDPPASFESWMHWKSWGRTSDLVLDAMEKATEAGIEALPPNAQNSPNVSSSDAGQHLSLDHRAQHGALGVDRFLSSLDSQAGMAAAVSSAMLLSRPLTSSLELQRSASLLTILAHGRSGSSSNQRPLSQVLSDPPYSMPEPLLRKLQANADVQSLVRRIGLSGGVHFEVGVAVELVMLTSQVVLWHRTYRGEC